MTTISPKNRPNFVLASSSKYRLAQLKERFGWSMDTIAPDVDEAPFSGESIADTACRLSYLKTLAVLPKIAPGSIVIAGDQTAEFNGELLHKPGSFDIAADQLAQFSGNELRFYSGICVLRKGDAVSDDWRKHTRVVETKVRFKTLSEAQIERYLKIDEPFDCVGAFKNERLGIALFSSISSDDPSALTGLPLIAMCELLGSLGVDVLSC